MQTYVYSFLHLCFLCQNLSIMYVSNVQWEVCGMWMVLILIPLIKADPRERCEGCRKVVCHGTYIMSNMVLMDVRLAELELEK